MTDLIVICPTRHPEKAQKLATGFAEHHGPGTELVLAIDRSDPQAYFPKPWAYDSHSAVEALNLAALEHAPRSRYVGYMGDDMEIITPDWDGRIIKTLDRMGGGLAYVNDLTFNGPPLPTTIFMSSSAVIALGWLALPELRELFFDDAWRELGKRMGKLFYLPDVLIRHHGFTDHPEAFIREKPIFEQWCAQRLDRDAQLVLAAL